MTKPKQPEELLNKEKKSQDAIVVVNPNTSVTPVEEIKVQSKETTKSTSKSIPQIPELTAEQLTNASHQFVDAYNKSRNL
jgi:hypothetical protein